VLILCYIKFVKNFYNLFKIFFFQNTYKIRNKPCLINIFLILIFVGIFGLFHGIAHGLEIPAASSPILFILGFICGTTALHIFGVTIGHLSIKNSISLILLRIMGITFAIYGIYLFFRIFYI
tara:strand:- start:104 stop:469 length:366 start_codon:yes stop_codon:yes gene_type:complete